MSLRDYARVLREHALLIATVALLAAAGAYALALREPARYQADAQVLLQHVDVSAVVEDRASTDGGVQPDRNASTQARLARQRAVARRALRAAGQPRRSADDLLDSSSVASDPTSDVLGFSVRDGSRERARRLATAYAKAFVAYSRSLERQPFLATAADLQRQLEDLRSSGRGGGPLATGLTARLAELQTLAALQGPGAVVVGNAEKARKVQPRPLRAVAIGLPVGILLGIVLALARNLADTRVRTTADIERWLGMPLLGRIPPLPRRLRRAPVLLEEPGRYASSFLRLRANVELANAVNGGPVILVTSVSGGELESKSVTVANTGLALARAGHRVVLVDLDLHHRSLAQVFRLPPEPGITDVLLGRSTLDEALRQVGPYPDLEAAPHRWPRRRRSRAETLGYIRVGGALDVLTLGTVPANPADVVGTRALAALVEHLRRRADIVLLDTPPLLQSAEAIAVSPLADSVAVVVRVGQERRAALGEARRLLDLSPVAKLGFVATGSAVRPGRTHDGEADRHYRDLQRELVS